MEFCEVSWLLDLGVMKVQDATQVMVAVDACFMTPKSLGSFSVMAPEVV